MTHPAPTIGVVGVGAMGGAFAAGLAPHAAVTVEDSLPGRAAEVAAAIGVSAGDAALCDVVVLAVKPQDLAATCELVVPRMASDAVVVSVAAGWTLERLMAVAPGHPIVRLMPNLAVAHGNGVVAMATTGLDEVAVTRMRALLAPLGAVVAINEDLFGVATAIAGSGPGFVAHIAKAFEDAGVAHGLPRDDARAMVQAVLAGTASLLADGGDPAALQARVTSPGGTTAAGVAVLEDAGTASTLGEAVGAAARRAAEL
jgi:pyrroline-5-carboxylate reductase